MRGPNDKATDAVRHGKSPFSHDRLMEISQQRLSVAAHSGSDAERVVAMRVLDNPRDFSHWECRHAQIVKRIVDARKLGPQRCVLLSASLQLIHQKALFEYLRASGVRGHARVQLMQKFFPHNDYQDVIVSEHGRFIRSAASYLCSSHIGAHVMLDEIFEQPLIEYETMYAEYFRVYCEWIGGTSKTDPAAAEAQALEMKHQVCAWHKALLDLSHSRSGIWRRPTSLR
jgi:hypothetical protein